MVFFQQTGDFNPPPKYISLTMPLPFLSVSNLPKPFYNFLSLNKNKMAESMTINMEEEISLQGVGDISKDNYTHDIQDVDPWGLLTTPSLILKMYHMLPKKRSSINEVLIPESMCFLRKEIQKGNILPLIGMGFAILSKDMLNVARWDSKYPHVLKNQIYEFTPLSKGETKRNVFDSAVPLTVSEAGAFCIWELGIVAYEKDRWKNFLNSGRTLEDKKRYLENFVVGDL